MYRMTALLQLVRTSSARVTGSSC